MDLPADSLHGWLACRAVHSHLLYIVFQIRRVGKTGAVYIGGSADAQSQVGMSGPVAAVVAAGTAWQGIVGDLIAGIAMLREKTPGVVIHFPVGLLIRQCRKFSFFKEIEKRCPGLNDQAVGGNVLRLPLHRLPQ